MGLIGGIPPNIQNPQYCVQYPSDRPSYVVNFNVNPTVTMDMFAIECGPSKYVRLERIVIDNVGMLTTAGMLALALIRTTVSGAGSLVTPVGLDEGDPPFTGLCRSGNSAANLGTAGVTIAMYNMWIPAAVGPMTPLVLEMGGQGQVYKQPLIKTGVNNGISLRNPGGAGGAGFCGYAVFCEESLIP
jgi:hypothetical protein